MFDWLLPSIHRKLDQIMADLARLTAAVQNDIAVTGTLVTTVDNAVTELRRLGGIIEAGDPISQQELDDLADALEGGTAAVADSSVALQAAVDEDETPPA